MTGFLLGCALLAGLTQTRADDPPPSDDPRHPACVAARINELTVSGVEGFSPVTDYCSETELPSAVATTLTRLGALHEQAARFLGVTPAELLPTGISVRLRVLPLGPDSSFVANTVVVLGIWPDFGNPTAPDDGLNGSLYLHELGHLILASKPAFLQRLLEGMLLDLSGTVLFMETFSDFLAWAESGVVIDPDPHFVFPQLAKPEMFEKCFRVRNVTEGSSYDWPEQMFDMDFLSRRLNLCCDGMEKFGASNEITAPMCRSVRKNFPVANLPKLEIKKKLDPAHVIANRSRFDPHLIGLPTSSFWLELSRKLNRPPLELIKTSLRSWEGGETRGRKEFDCAFRAFDSAATRVKVRAPSYSKLLLGLAPALNDADRKIYKGLWKKHGMSKAAAISIGESAEWARKAAGPLLIQRMKADADPVLNPRNTCYPKFGSRLPIDPACQLVCHPGRN